MQWKVGNSKLKFQQNPNSIFWWSPVKITYIKIGPECGRGEKGDFSGQSCNKNSYCLVEHITSLAREDQSGNMMLCWGGTAGLSTKHCKAWTPEWANIQSLFSE